MWPCRAPWKDLKKGGCFLWRLHFEGKKRWRWRWTNSGSIGVADSVGFRVFPSSEATLFWWHVPLILSFRWKYAVSKRKKHFKNNFKRIIKGTYNFETRSQAHESSNWLCIQFIWFIWAHDIISTLKNDEMAMPLQVGDELEGTVDGVRPDKGGREEGKRSSEIQCLAGWVLYYACFDFFSGFFW